VGTLLARLNAVTAGYGGRQVIHDITLDLPRGRSVAVLGPSGAGKSTLIRVLTRELQPLRGSVEFPDGAPPREGVVHQDPLLLDWLTIRENVALGLRFSRNAGADPARAEELLELLGLGTLAEAWPDEVSGGQAQRAALARALAISPGLLLLDEPFSSLDPGTRADLQHWLRRLQGPGLTTVMVTHDIDEALILADHIVLLDARGRLAHGWDNPAPAVDAAAALVHPLRSAIRRGYDDTGIEASDEEFSSGAVGVPHG